MTDLKDLLEKVAAHETSDSIQDAPLAGNELRYMLAALHQRAGQQDSAIQLYREVATNDLGNYMAHVQLARIYESGSDWTDAILERRAAANANPDDYSLLMDLGVTLGKAGRFTEAEPLLVQARSANPRDARVHYWLGLVQLRMNRREDARESFRAFLALAPSRFANQIATARQRLAELQ